MKLCYIANVNSPHVKEWLELLDEGTSVTFATIENSIDDGVLKHARIHIDEVIRPPKVTRYLPKLLQYVFLGITLVQKRDEKFAFHAHNASGYGLSAAISGQPYLLTTYGSEIFHSKAKSKLYNYLIKIVLGRSLKLTATTQAMQSHLAENFSVPANKVDVFSLGINNAFFESAPEKAFDAEKGPVWFSNRRILPLYRTLEIVDAFIAFKSNGGKGTLILLQGDADGKYFEQVKSQISGRTDIRLVRGFVDTDTIIGLLDEAHFTISVPKTDQLSSSVLEPMARKCIPIVADLAAYKILDGCLIKIANTGNFQHLLEESFRNSSNLSKSEYDLNSNSCFDEVFNRFSKNEVKYIYQKILSTL